MYKCEHGTPKNCPECGAPEKDLKDTITYKEAEGFFKIPAQTIRSAVRIHGLTELSAINIEIVVEEIQDLVNLGKIGLGPVAKKLKRKRG